MEVYQLFSLSIFINTYFWQQQTLGFCFGSASSIDRLIGTNLIQLTNISKRVELGPMDPKTRGEF